MRTRLAALSTTPGVRSWLLFASGCVGTADLVLPVDPAAYGAAIIAEAGSFEVVVVEARSLVAGASVVGAAEGETFVYLYSESTEDLGLIPGRLGIPVEAECELAVPAVRLVRRGGSDSFSEEGAGSGPISGVRVKPVDGCCPSRAAECARCPEIGIRTIPLGEFGETRSVASLDATHALLIDHLGRFVRVDLATGSVTRLGARGFELLRTIQRGPELYGIEWDPTDDFFTAPRRLVRARLSAFSEDEPDVDALFEVLTSTAPTPVSLAVSPPDEPLQVLTVDGQGRVDRFSDGRWGMVRATRDPTVWDEHFVAYQSARSLVISSSRSVSRIVDDVETPLRVPWVRPGAAGIITTMRTLEGVGILMAGSQLQGEQVFEITEGRIQTFSVGEYVFDETIRSLESLDGTVIAVLGPHLAQIPRNDVCPKSFFIDIAQPWRQLTRVGEELLVTGGFDDDFREAFLAVARLKRTSSP